MRLDGAQTRGGLRGPAGAVDDRARPGHLRELRIGDELHREATLDAALRRIRSGATPRILLIDLGESAAPIAEVSAARAVGGAELKIVVLGTVNDVALYRDLLSAGASDYLVKPSPAKRSPRYWKATAARPERPPTGWGR